jgi:site-specific recombinase XerD
MGIPAPKRPCSPCWAASASAEVSSTAHPHRSRHTFAVTFPRNCGNRSRPEMALGHATPAMVKNYLSLVQADLDAVHKTASPPENWRLKE